MGYTDACIWNPLEVSMPKYKVHTLPIAYLLVVEKVSEGEHSLSGVHIEWTILVEDRTGSYHAH